MKPFFLIELEEEQKEVNKLLEQGKMIPIGEELSNLQYEIYLRVENIIIKENL